MFLAGAVRSNSLAIMFGRHELWRNITRVIEEFSQVQVNQKTYRTEGEWPIAEIMKLRTELNGQQSATADIQHAYETLDRRYTILQDTTRAESLTLQYQKVDEVICGAFEIMVGQVKTWAFKEVSSIPLDNLTLDPSLETLRHMAVTAPNYTFVDDQHEYFTDSKLRKFLVRGLIHLMLSESVFKGLDYEGIASTRSAPWPWLQDGPSVLHPTS